MIKLTNILQEIIDIYKPEELKAKGVEYTILQDTPKRFKALLNYKDSYYLIAVLPLLDPQTPTVNFGITDKEGTSMDISPLTNSPYTPLIAASLLGLFKEWVNKHNIQAFRYAAEGNIRNSLYNLYLTKHFPDFKQIVKDDSISWVKKSQ
jgi:hypothetical protein